MFVSAAATKAQRRRSHKKPQPLCTRKPRDVRGRLPRDRKNASKDRPDSSRNVVSSDGRLCFGDDPAGDGEDGGGLVSSDWLLAGETARAGMIESIASENSEQSGPAVVWGGAFQARLLRPSQVARSKR